MVIIVFIYNYIVITIITTLITTFYSQNNKLLVVEVLATLYGQGGVCFGLVSLKNHELKRKLDIDIYNYRHYK